MYLNRAEVETELQGLSPADFRRVKIMARLYSRGLIHLSYEDLIQETYTKLLAGERVFPSNTRPVVIVISAMHSDRQVTVLAANSTKRQCK